MMKVATFDRVAEALALTTLLLMKADSVFPHQKRNIERSLSLKNGAFSRLKMGN